jgi:hypothetical protein
MVYFKASPRVSVLEMRLSPISYSLQIKAYVIRVLRNLSFKQDDIALTRTLAD